MYSDEYGFCCFLFFCLVRSIEDAMHQQIFVQMWILVLTLSLIICAEMQLQVPKILAAAAAPVNKKQPLTVEEKRSQIREWGGQGRIQKITGVICDPPVSSQHSPSSSRGGPRNYVKEVDVVPSTFSSSVKQGGSPAITANANDLLSSSPASSFQPAKRTPTNLPDAAQVQSYYKQKFDLVAEVDDEEYHIISPQEAGDAAAWDDITCSGVTISNVTMESEICLA
ncbi:unnamed protein product [Amoebophrya sp. A120]|nr:unnamed protein product [Amoebophrya sp. A120]|eukprot:GSA120T00002392001.1